MREKLREGTGEGRIQPAVMIGIAKQIWMILCFLSLFFLAAMCSPIVMVRQNRLFVFAVWSLTLFLFFCYCIKKAEEIKKAGAFLFWKEKILEKKEILAVLFLTAIVRIPMFGDLPRGDAAIYYSALIEACKNFDFTFQSFWNGFRLAGHPTLGYAFFMSIGEFVLPGKMVGYLSVGLVLTTWALYCLYQLFQGYWLNADKKRAALYVALISCTPLFFGTFSYVNPDYYLIIFFIFMSYAESRGRYISMLFWFVVLALTKETGMLAAGVYIVVKYSYGFICASGGFRKRLHYLIKNQTTYVILTGGICIILYFIKQQGLFGWNGMTVFSLFGKESYQGVFENRFDFRPRFVLNQIKQVFLLNFSWIFFLIIIFSITYIYVLKRKNRKNGEGIKGKESIVGMIGSFLLEVIFLALFITAPLNRYHIFTATVLAILMCICYETALGESIKREKGKFAGGVVITVLLAIQTFFSIDLLSNVSFERMDTGKMIMLETGGDFEDKYGDPLVNNYQYTWQDEELDTMLKTAGYDSDMLIIDIGREREAVRVGGSGGSNIGWNKEKKKRELIWEWKERPAEVVSINTTSTRRMQMHLSADSEDAPHFYHKYMADCPRALAYFIKYYEEPEEEWLQYLSQYYEIGERKETDGLRGNIVYYTLTLKNRDLYPVEE